MCFYFFYINNAVSKRNKKWPKGDQYRQTRFDPCLETEDGDWHLINGISILDSRDNNIVFAQPPTSCQERGGEESNGGMCICPGNIMDQE